jgi:N-acyl-D-aspartate/D-glutamate deacylase
MCSVFLQGGQLVDGSGTSALAAGVAIVGDAIVAIGHRAGREARRTAV